MVSSFSNDGAFSPRSRLMLVMFEPVLQSMKEYREVMENQQEKIVRLLQAALEVDEELASSLGQRNITRSLSSIEKDLSTNKTHTTHSFDEELNKTSYPYVSEDTLDSALEGETTCLEEDCGKPNVREMPSLINSVPSKRSVQSMMRKLSMVSLSDAFHGSTSLLKPSVALPMLKKFIGNPRFDLVMSVVILLNAIYIGFQLEDSIDNGDERLPVPDYLFMCIYIVELGLRCWAFGIGATLRNGWNRFDAVLVAVGSISLFVIAPINQHADLGRSAQTIYQITLFRLFRLLRLVRSLMFLQQFSILWSLVNGLLHSLPVILSTLGLLCLLIYIFACGGIELITKSEFVQSQADNDPELRAIVDQYFGTLPLVSLTLIRFTTMDSIGAIYEPLIKARPLLILYFLLVLLVIGITVMNLITAILVENSIHMAKEDSEVAYQAKRNRLRQLVPRIKDLFQQLDKDCDGFVTLEEAIACDDKIPEDLSKLVGSDTFGDLCEALGGGSIGIVSKEDFVEGFAALVLSEVPIETVKLLHYGRLQSAEIRAMRAQLEALHNDGVAFGDCRQMVRRLMCSCLATELGANGEDRGRLPKEKSIPIVPSMRVGATAPRHEDDSRTPRQSARKPSTPLCQTTSMAPERRRIRTP